MQDKNCSAKKEDVKKHAVHDQFNFDWWEEVNDEELLLADSKEFDNQCHIPPISELSTRRGHLWVTDLTRQMWCETKMMYMLAGVKPSEEIEENPVVISGTNIHLTRELQAHDVVEVAVSSREDRWAIKFLNLLITISGFQSGVTMAREVPIFGSLFGHDIFITGIIDEMRYDPELLTVDIYELKTRNKNCLPVGCQKMQHSFQVMLYKRLFDNLVFGKTTADNISKHLHLDLTKSLGDSVTQSLNENNLKVTNLCELLDTLLPRMQCLTFASQLFVEYVDQTNAKTIGIVCVKYDDNWLKKKVDHFMEYWNGHRPATGVEIEEAWKCQCCEFADICDWRKLKSEECIKRNKLSIS